MPRVRRPRRLASQTAHAEIHGCDLDANPGCLTGHVSLKLDVHWRASYNATILCMLSITCRTNRECESFDANTTIEYVWGMATNARSIASLKISFGLVAIPVKLYSATVSSERISFNLLRQKDGSRVKQQNVAVNDGALVQRHEMTKGYEFAKDQYVMFSAEELESPRGRDHTHNRYH